MRRITPAAAGLFVLAAAVVLRLGPAGFDPRLALAADHPVPAPLKAPLPTAFECRWADTPVTLDGAADEPAWKDAQPIDAFHLPWLGDKGRMARTATKARLLWDREYLYFSAEMDDSDLFAGVTEHDGNTWDDDVFELFFRPDRTKPGYYEFQVNAAGTKFDCFFPKRNPGDFDKQKKLGAFHIDAKVKLRGTLNKRTDADRGWAVEGRIPWTDFLRTGGRPEPGEQWAFNLCRYDYNAAWKEPELSCVAPVKGKNQSADFHEIESYATLMFVGAGGAAKRPPLTTSTVVGFPDPPPAYRAVRALPDYRPAFPVMVKNIPGGTGMLLINQTNSGGATMMRRFTDAGAATGKDDVKVIDTPLGGVAYDLAFHPKFAANGYVYVGWNGGEEKAKKQCRVTRYTMKTAPPYDLDPKTATTVIAWESDGHNGAALCFGTDGMLYVTSGDGTSDSDTNLTGQRTDLLLAKVLRIDVDHPAEGKQYGVPKDNPYVADKRFVPETWAYGLRNPWRITSDSKTGHVWVAQNGQDLWEQAYFVRKGENYGWSVTEGSHPFYPERKTGPTPIVEPTVEHHHSEARSLTGGIVYHGDKLPGLEGAYLYGDYSTGNIWAVKHDGTKVTWHEKVAATPLKITAFATDSKGELLICDHAGPGEGGFYTLEPNPAPKTTTFPKTLSASGLFDAVASHTMKPGVVPYSVNAPFWSDGAHKERFIALPGDTRMTFTRHRAWTFPDTAVLVKSFALEQTDGDPATRKWIETRFFTKQGGEWYGYTYKWNDAGTDAALVAAPGEDHEYAIRTAAGGVRKQVWHYPSRSECMVCHSRAQGFVLGLCELQMNKDHDTGGGKIENQIRGLERRGMFAFDWYADVKGGVNDPVNKPEAGQRGVKPATLFTHFPTDLKELVNPYDPKADLTLRAKSWLHTNCSSCHVEAGGGNALMELEFGTALDKMRVLDVKPVHQTFGLPDARLVAPGAPERSVLLHRMSTRGPGQMPPLSSTRPDDAGVALIREWCRSLKK